LRGPPLVPSPRLFRSAAACARAGVGSTVTLKVGGKVDDRHGAPIEVTGRVRTLSDGRFVYKGPMSRGLEGRLGTTAVLDANDVKDRKSTRLNSSHEGR